MYKGSNKSVLLFFPTEFLALFTPEKKKTKKKKEKKIP